MTDSTAYDPVTAPPVCPRHPDRVSYVRCQRCGRPTCPECQRPAAVGIQCVDCVREQARTVRTGRTIFGGRVTDGRPTVTITLIAVCAVVWLAQLTTSGVTNALDFVPALGWSEPWRFLTSAFAHSPAMPLHILFNMYALWIVGGYIEPMLGRARYLALFLLSALGGGVMVLLLASPPDPATLQVSASAWNTGVVGASGAVFGLFGALLVLNRHLGRSSAGMYATLVINAVFGFVVPRISWQGHLGGFLTGLAVAAVITYTGRQPRRQWMWLGVITAVLVAAAVAKYLTLPAYAAVV
jgi:membrane associated rhomboid family serine protease